MQDPNLERFSGFAPLYDAVRPAPPRALGELLCAYAGTDRPAVVDLGSGTGLSSRWAATWARTVTGIEPNDDMRAVAEARPAAHVAYRKATASATGLDTGCADVVVAVQALHWMDPEPTFAEVGRLLRPGGVFAAVDADWPPVAGSARAERAWIGCDRRIGLLERRRVAGEDVGTADLGSSEEDPASLGTPDVAEPPGERPRGGGVRSWGKEGHLARMAASGRFTFTREVLFDDGLGDGTEEDASRFIALLHSQGSFQQLHEAGANDGALGAAAFEDEVRRGFEERPVPFRLSISWRVRVGVAG